MSEEDNGACGATTELKIFVKTSNGNSEGSSKVRSQVTFSSDMGSPDLDEVRNTMGVFYTSSQKPISRTVSSDENPEQPAKNKYENQAMSGKNKLSMHNELEDSTYSAGHQPSPGVIDEDVLISGFSADTNPDEIAQALIHAINEKNIKGLNAILSDFCTLNLYLYVDHTGVSMLERAVTVGSSQILDILIDKSPYKEERLAMMIHALNISIRQNNIELVKYLLRKKQSESVQKQKRTCLDPNDEGCWARAALRSVVMSATQRRMSRFEDSRFADSISPIILAAQLDREEIVELLLNSGESDIHSVTAPCPAQDTCTMYSCNSSTASLFTLEKSHSLIQKYQALASPSFILNSGVPDPIFEAFKLTEHLDALSQDDPAFRVEYQNIAQKCRTFVSEFTCLCRTSQELDALIHEQPDEGTVLCCGGQLSHNRIQEALSYNQTEFVTHPHIQKYLQKAWYAGCPDFVPNNLSGIKKYFFLCLFFICYPFLAVVYITQLSPFVNRLMETGVLKFFAHLMSYISFLVVLFINAISLEEWHEDNNYQRGWAFYYIAFWVMGFTVDHVSLIVMRIVGCRYSYKTLLYLWSERRLFDSVMIISLAAALISHFLYMSQVAEAVVMSMHSVAALYSIACLLSFLRVCSYTKESRIIGPLYISLKRVTLDTLKFCVLLFVFMLAYVVAAIYLTKSHHPVIMVIHTQDSNTNSTSANMSPDAPETLINRGIPGPASANQPDHYHVPGNSTLTPKEVFGYFYGFFWTLFGYEEDYNQENSLLSSVLREEKIHPSVLYEIVCYFVLIAYFITVPLVLLNMLIAMMANSYTRVEANSDSEWKFARSRLRMSCIHDVGVMPAPLNLIFIPQIVKFIKWHCNKTQPQLKRRSSTIEFSELMSRLSKRFRSNTRKLDEDLWSDNLMNLHHRRRTRKSYFESS